MTAAGHAQRGRAAPAPTLAEVVAAVVLVLLTAHVAHAEVISGCTVNDATRIVESCTTGTTVAYLNFRNIRGFEAGAFPAGSALTQL